MTATGARTRRGAEPPSCPARPGRKGDREQSLIRTGLSLPRKREPGARRWWKKAHEHRRLGCNCFTDTYWDTDTSGVTDLSEGSGNIPDEPGISGLTSQQLKSGLPAGFDPAVWREKRRINRHFPYLVLNPPPW